MGNFIFADVTFTFFLASIALAEVTPPAPYEDIGVCPFECCSYREWEANDEIVLQEAARIDAKVIGRISKQTRVQAKTGKVVVSKPGEFEVIKAHEKFKPHDRIYLYSSLGEGIHRVWFNGKWEDLDLGCCSDESVPGCYTKDDKNCWGKVVKQPESVWWAQIETPSHQIGWTKDTDKFGNQDMCG